MMPASYAAAVCESRCARSRSVPGPLVNAERVREALASAAEQGADLAVFPEATQVRFGSDLRAAAEPLDGPFGSGLAAAAKEAGVALVAGVFEPAPDGRVYNTAVAYDGAGELVASYRKLHLFDAFGHRESDLVAPGSVPVLVYLGRRADRAGDLLRRAVRRAVPGAGGGRGLLRAARGVGRGAAEGGALGHAGAGAGHREHRGWLRWGRCPTRTNRPPGPRPGSGGACWSTRWAWSGSIWGRRPGVAVGSVDVGLVRPCGPRCRAWPTGGRTCSAPPVAVLR